jgi:soluble lytic murein transglycosylase-like protein
MRTEWAIAERQAQRHLEDMIARAERMDRRLYESQIALPAYQLYQLYPEMVKHKKLTRADVIQLIIDVAKAMGENPAIALAIARQESSFNINARSPKGAIGLFQLMPATARGLNVDPHNPVENVIGGLTYFIKMRCKFQGYTTLGLAAYNAGPGAVIKYNGIPEYDETQKYIKAVYKYYHAFNKGDYDV